MNSKSKLYNLHFKLLIAPTVTVIATVTSAPIGAWKCNLPLFRENYDRPTDYPTNNMRILQDLEVTLPINW